MKKHLDREIKVGIFISIGLALMMVAILIVGGESLFTKTFTYQSNFTNVEGLIPGAKVTLGGVPVGTVDRIDFDYKQHQVTVIFSIQKSVSEWIRADSSVEIATQGVLGDRYLSVNPGTESEPILSPGETIPTRPGKDLSQFISKGDQLMVSLNSIAMSLDGILKTFSSENRSEIFFKGLTSTAKNMGQLTDKLNQEFDHIQLKQAMGQLSQILEKINNGTGTLGALVNDPGLYDQAKALLGGANRNRIIRNLVRQTIRDSDEESDVGDSSPQRKPVSE